MTKSNAEEVANKIIGQTVVGLRIDYDTETLVIELSEYDVEFTGDGMRMEVFNLDGPKLN